VFVCICNGITDTQIRAAVARGANSLEALNAGLQVASSCGECACMAQQLIDDEMATLAVSLAHAAA